jgi:hypothetical protein
MQLQWYLERAEQQEGSKAITDKQPDVLEDRCAESVVQQRQETTMQCNTTQHILRSGA